MSGGDQAFVLAAGALYLLLPIIQSYLNWRQARRARALVFLGLGYLVPPVIWGIALYLAFAMTEPWGRMLIAGTMIVSPLAIFLLGLAGRTSASRGRSISQ